MNNRIAPRQALYLRTQNGVKTAALTRAPQRKRPGAGGRAIAVAAGVHRDILYPRLSRIMDEYGTGPLQSDTLHLAEEYIPLDEWMAAKTQLMIRVADLAGEDYALIETLADAAATMSAAEACWWLSLMERPAKAKRALKALRIMSAPLEQPPSDSLWLPRNPDGAGHVATLRVINPNSRANGGIGSITLLGANNRAMGALHSRKAKTAIQYICEMIGKSLNAPLIRLTEPQTRKIALLMAGANRIESAAKRRRYGAAIAAMHDCESGWWHSAYANERNPKDGIAAIAALYA